MFEIEEKRRVLTSLPIIIENFEIIHFDEIPYLYFGTNKYGTKIVGSFLIEDELTGNLRYIHSLINNSNFHKFIKREISYRHLIESSTDIYIIDKNINEKPISIYSVSADIIPENILPVSNYYCPKYSFSIGNDFILSLHGNIADTHSAFPFELSNIQEKFEKILSKAFEIYENLHFLPIIKQKPYTSGSFQLRFNISFSRYNELFIQQEEIYNSISLVLEKLIPNHTLEVLDDQAIKQFVENNELIELIKHTLNPHTFEISEDFKANTIEKFEKIIQYYSELTSGMGNGYNEIELLAEKRNTDDLIPITLMDSSTHSKLEDILSKIEASKHTLETDQNFKEYKICIYSLNTDSRIGKAIIYNKENDETMDKPSIKIEGNESLDHTIFTESLHLNKWIKVNAKASLRDGKFNKLSIDNL